MKLNSKLTLNDSSMAYFYLLLILLTVLAAVLRLRQLGYWSFWIDEIITVNTTIEIYQGGFWPTELRRVGPSYWLIGPTIYWLGVSEWSMRLVPAVIGIVSIPLLSTIVYRFFNVRVALIFATFLTISHWHIHISQNARYISSLVLFYTLALLFFYWGFEKERPFLLLLAGLFFMMAILERLFAFLLVPVLGIYLLSIFLLPGTKRPAGINWRYLALLIVPVVVGVLVTAQKFLREPTLWLSEFVGRPGPGPLAIFFDFGNYMSLPLIGLAVVGAMYLALKAPRPERKSAGLYFGLAAFVPLIGIMAASLVQFADVRYSVVAMPAFFMLAALAIDELYTSIQRPSHWLVIGILAVFLVEPFLGTHWYYINTNPVWPNFRSAYGYVEQQRQPGDLVASDQVPLGEYYLAESVLSIRSHEIEPYLEIDQLEGGTARTWFVISGNIRNVSPDYYRWLEDEADLQYQLGRVRVYLYEGSVNEVVSPD